MPSSEMESMVLVEHPADGVVTLRLNRPQQYNALSVALIEECLQHLQKLQHEKTVRVIIIAANGVAFCAGHDLKEMQAQQNPAFLRHTFDRCSALMQAIRQMPQPVIAEVQGIATAAGCQLVAECDLAVATENARFATSGINLGLFCGTPAVPLSRNVAQKKALELLLTGEFIDAQTALNWGLLNAVVPKEALATKTLALAEKIAHKSHTAIALGKRLFYQQLPLTETAAYGCAIDAMVQNAMLPDFTEGLQAFFEKRPPVWNH